MSHDLLTLSGWDGLRGRLPAGFDLAATAKELAALRRPRGVPDAAALLRLALVYANTPLSLRGTVAWAAASGVAELSDVALLYRLRNAEAWLAALLGRLLSAEAPAMPSVRRPVEIVDATNLAAPGGRPGVAWRIHGRFDPLRGRFAQLRLAQGPEAESLAHMAPAAGTILVADRIYAKAKGLLAAKGHGADVVVRYGMTGCALLDPAGPGSRMCCGGPTCPTAPTSRCACRSPSRPGRRRSTPG